MSQRFTVQLVEERTSKNNKYYKSVKSGGQIYYVWEPEDHSTLEGVGPGSTIEVQEYDTGGQYKKMKGIRVIDYKIAEATGSEKHIGTQQHSDGMARGNALTNLTNILCAGILTKKENDEIWQVIKPVLLKHVKNGSDNGKPITHKDDGLKKAWNDMDKEQQYQKMEDMTKRIYTDDKQRLDNIETIQTALDAGKGYEKYLWLKDMMPKEDIPI